MEGINKLVAAAMRERFARDDKPELSGRRESVPAEPHCAAARSSGGIGVERVVALRQLVRSGAP